MRSWAISDEVEKVKIAPRPWIVEEEYKFIRLRVTGEGSISSELNAYLKERWKVVSHAEYDGEYSFVLIRDLKEEK